MINRKKETLELIKAISSSKNALLYAPLYGGKSTFLKQVIQELNKENVTYMYINCKKCFDEKSFLSEFSKEVLRILSGEITGAVKDAYKILPTIKPSINTNSARKLELSMSYNLTSEDITKFMLESLHSPYKISKARSEQILVMLDDYDNLLAIETLKIHDFISKSLNQGVIYILTTSDLELFSSFDKKMQKKLSIEYYNTLAKPTNSQIEKYIRHYLKDQTIEDEAILFLIKTLSSDIKTIDNFISHIGKNDLTIRAIKKTVTILLEEKEAIFQQFFDSLSTHQKRLIIAIAKHSGKHVFKSEFIYNNGLISVPSVQTSIKGLIKKQFVYKDNTGVQITDVLFAEWLKGSF